MKPLAQRPNTFAKCTYIAVATAPPSAPQGLSAANLNPTSFTLSWDRPINIYNEPYRFTISCNETSYGNDGPRSIATNLDVVSYTVRSLQPGATYQCCVSAVNNAGENSTCADMRTMEIGECVFNVIHKIIFFYSPYWVSCKCPSSCTQLHCHNALMDQTSLPTEKWNHSSLCSEGVSD